MPFYLLLSYTSREPSGNIFLWCTPPPPHWKIRQIDSPPPLPPFHGGVMDIFWNHTLHCTQDKNYSEENWLNIKPSKNKINKQTGDNTTFQSAIIF